MSAARRFSAQWLRVETRLKHLIDDLSSVGRVISSERHDRQRLIGLLAATLTAMTIGQELMQAVLIELSNEPDQEER